MGRPRLVTSIRWKGQKRVIVSQEIARVYIETIHSDME